MAPPPPATQSLNGSAAWSGTRALPGPAAPGVPLIGWALYATALFTWAAWWKDRPSSPLGQLLFAGLALATATQELGGRPGVPS